MYDTAARTKNLFRLAALAGLLAWAGCGQAPLEPAPLALNETVCSHCRMAISQQRFSAQVVDTGGHVEFFDDVGCLLRWLQENPDLNDSETFVADYSNGRWLRAREAIFIEGDQIQTPMGFGIIAVGPSEEAASLPAGGTGRRLTWDEVVSDVD